MTDNKVLHLEDRNKLSRSGNMIGNICLDNIMDKADSEIVMDHAAYEYIIIIIIRNSC